MSSCVAGARPRMRRDSKVRENQKKENQKEPPPRRGGGAGRVHGAKGAGSRRKKRGLVWRSGGSRGCQNLSGCHTAVYVYVYEMYVNLICYNSILPLPVSCGCRWCTLAQCVCISRLKLVSINSERQFTTVLVRKKRKLYFLL